MTQHSRVIQAIENLEGVVSTRGPWLQGSKWSSQEAWEQVKITQAAFDETRFPTLQERQDAWRKFQELIRRIRERQANESGRLKDEIVRLADLATPKEWWIETLLTLGLAELLRIAFDSLPGPDIVKSDLQNCSRNLKKAKEFYRENKREVLNQDRLVALEALKNCQDKLDSAWSEYKQGMRRAYELRQEERRDKIRANIKKNREKVERLENALSRKHENLEKNRRRAERLERLIERKNEHLDQLYDRLGSAWTDSYRERVEEWIEEQKTTIEEITEKLERTWLWIKEDESSVSDISDKIELVSGWIEEDKRRL